MTDGWPERSEVDQAWREVITGARRRESVHDWAVPWVEGELAHERAADSMVRDGLLSLHGFGLSFRDSDGLRRYQVDDAEVVVRHGEWVARCADYDKDPDGWRRRRVELARQSAVRWRDARRARELARTAPVDLPPTDAPRTVRRLLEPHEVTSRIDRLDGLLDLSVALPESPFPQDGYVDLCAFDLIYEGLFPMMVSSVAQHHGDDHVDFVTTEPDPVDYFVPAYGFSASFTEPVPLSAASFGEAVSFAPGDDPTGSIAIATNNFVISGDSRSWVVYGCSRWDAILVWSNSRSRPWLAQGDTFLSPAELFEAYVQPGVPGARWSEQDAARFLSAIPWWPESASSP